MHLPAFAPGAGLPLARTTSHSLSHRPAHRAAPRPSPRPSHRPQQPSMRTRRKPRLEIELPESLSLAGVVRALDGTDFDFASTAGKVVLAVNIATLDGGAEDQLASLSALHAKYADAGLVVIGVPCNWFGQYEPGTDDEIAARLADAGVHFVCLSKIANFDIEAMPLFEMGVRKFPEDILWNFEGKFLFDKKGQPVARFDLLTTADYLGPFLPPSPLFTS